MKTVEVTYYEKRKRFSAFGGGWDACMQGLPDEPPKKLTVDSAEWWMLGWVTARDAVERFRSGR